MIAHIVSSCLSDDEVTLVTCVQNKAVDAIAQKLGSLPRGELPFFVAGNVARLGIDAIKWTIDCQVDRDPRVVALAQCRYRYGRLYVLFSDFFAAKNLLLNRNYLQGRREKIAETKKFKNFQTETAFLTRDLWGRFWKVYIMSKYPICYDALKYFKTLKKSADKELADMLVFVRKEIINTARVILATTATASGSLASSEDLTPAFLKLRTIIMDEAGTVPETKLPLLISLNPEGIERIIAIGDQKQLQPFSRLTYLQFSAPAKGNSICWEFSKTKSCKNRSSCRYEHIETAVVQTEEPMGFFQRLEKALPNDSIPTLTEQYRMHPTVCKLVADLFYNGLLNTPSFIADDRKAIDPYGLWWLTYEDKNAESIPDRSKSKQNITEAVLVVQLLINGMNHGRSVMAITFYKAQEHLIRDIFNDLNYIENEDCRILSVDQSQVEKGSSC